WLFAPSLAMAQYACSGPGPGEIMVGMTDGGNGVAPVPLCMEDPNADMPGEAYVEPSAPSDPLQGQVDMQMGWLTMASMGLSKEQEARQKLENDPQYQAYRKGTWEFSQSGSGASRRCSVFFGKLEGAIAVTGQKGDDHATFLTFMGPDIPNPGSTRKVQVTLEQTDSAPQTVQAFNNAVSADGMGAITFSVPVEIGAASDMFLDRQSFKLVLKGKPVFDLAWHSGKKAQKAMKKCAS
ncbi:MAG: hypothetical protein ORN49_10480, partial [Rhodobacteraceae bacterium]|nr:hypothetical protein [Paracoccaceae bacterium]